MSSERKHLPKASENENLTLDRFVGPGLVSVVAMSADEPQHSKEDEFDREYDDEVEILLNDQAFP